MSKTFKALQRAARDNRKRSPRPDRNQDQDSVREEAARETAPPADAPEMTSPIETILPPAEAKQEAVATPPPVRKPAPDIDGLFSQPYDPLLESLLQQAFGDDGCAVEGGSWVRGTPRADRARELLERHSLIHCIRVDDVSWFWFWSSEQEARTRAEKARLPFDLDAFGPA